MAILAAEKTVDFFIHELIPYNFFGQTVYITTTHVCELIIILGIIVFALIARHKIMHAEEVPRGFQNVVELLVETLQKYVYGSMGKHGTKCYVNYIGTIILLIFLCNISGLIGLITLYYSLLPVFVKIGIPAALHAYLDVFSGAIQAYVFTMLTMVFITNKIEG